MHFVFKYPDDRIQNCWTSHFKILAILSRVFNKRILFYKVSVNIIRILWLAVKKFQLSNIVKLSLALFSWFWQYIESRVISNDLLSYIFFETSQTSTNVSLDLKFTTEIFISSERVRVREQIVFSFFYSSLMP